MRIILILSLVLTMAGAFGCSKGEKVELVEDAAKGEPAKEQGAQPSMERPVLVTPQKERMPSAQPTRMLPGRAVQPSQPIEGQPKSAVPGQLQATPETTGVPTATSPAQPGPAAVPSPAPVQSMPASTVKPAAELPDQAPEKPSIPAAQPTKPTAPATTPASAAPAVPVPPPPPKQETLKPTVSPMKELEDITPPTTKAPSPTVTTSPAEEAKEEKKELKEEEKKIEKKVETGK